MSEPTQEEEVKDKFDRVNALFQFIRVEAETMGLTPYETLYALLDMSAALAVHTETPALRTLELLLKRMSSYEGDSQQNLDR